jgi:hypothetical protein
LLETKAKEVIALYAELVHMIRILSSAIHVKFRMKQRGPPCKTKYSYMTESEQVPRGNGEKNRCERSEIEPEMKRKQ